VGYNAVADDTGLFSFVLLLLLGPKSAKFRQTAKFSQNSTLYSSKSSKVIDPGVNRKRICNFLLVINSNFGRISYSLRDIDAFSLKIACFPTPPLFDATYSRGTPCAINIIYIHRWKVHSVGYNFVPDIIGLSSFV